MQRSFRLTSAKRKILEDVELYYSEENGTQVELSKADQRLRRKNACEKLVLVPGKLDHASVVAYNVGRYTKEENAKDVTFFDPVRETTSSSSEDEIRRTEDEINKNTIQNDGDGKRKSVYDNDEDAHDTPL